MLSRKFGNALQIVQRQNAPGGILGRVDDDHLRSRRDAARHLVETEAKLALFVQHIPVPALRRPSAPPLRKRDRQALHR